MDGLQRSCLIPGICVTVFLTGATYVQSSGVAGFFYASDYSTRVYIYEPSLWGNSSYPSAYYGEGVRTAVSARYTFPRGHWMAEVKYSFTQMLDRNTISSDNQEILSSARHDISMQLRLTY